MKVLTLGLVKSDGKLSHYAEIRVFHNVSVTSGNLILHSFVDALIYILMTYGKKLTNLSK